MEQYVETVRGGASAFSQPFMDMFAEMAAYVPSLLAGFALLILGLIVSPIIGKAVTKGLQMMKIDEGMDTIGAKDAMSSIGLEFTLSKLAGTIAKYSILIVFLTIVADTLQLGQLSRLIEDFIRFIPQIVIALVIMGLGLTVADWMRDTVSGIAKASDNEDYAGLLGNVTRISVIVFAGMAALAQLGIAEQLILIMFAGVVFALSLAFGLGAKDTVTRALDGWLKK